MPICKGSRPHLRIRRKSGNDIYAVTSNWFINRCPLVTRTPRLPVGSTTFTIIKRGFRTRIATVAATIATTDTQITLVDASPFMNGDVLELASGEHVEITADPILATNVVLVRRAAEGTTAATGSVNDQIRLISNSRSGAEINQNGVAQLPVGTSQFCQTWQHPVQIGGSLQASSAYQGAPRSVHSVRAEQDDRASEPHGRHGSVVVLRPGRRSGACLTSEAERAAELARVEQRHEPGQRRRLQGLRLHARQRSSSAEATAAIPTSCCSRVIS